MAHLLVVILYKSSQLPGLLDAWHELNVPGITVLRSAGGRRARNWLQQVGLGSIGELFGAEDVRSKTVLTVIEDDDLLKKAIVEAERAVGNFYQPGTGLLFVVPISHAVGIIRPETQVATPLPETRHPEAMTDVELITRDTPVSSIFDETLNLKPAIVQTHQPLIEVAEAMLNHLGVNVACVVDAHQHLVGLLSLRSLADDLFMVIVPEEFLSETHDLADAMRFAKLSSTHIAEDAMIPAVWVRKDDTLKEAFRKMHENRLSGIPIVNDQYEVTGYISLLELLGIYTRRRKSSNNQVDPSNA
jgi:CBS domain-containing protein